MLSKVSLTAAIASILFAGAVKADGFTEEWRAMGPAFSHHFTTAGQVVKPSTSKQECGTVDDGLGNTFTSDTPVPGMIAAPGSMPGGPYVYYRMAAYICHEVVTSEERRGWSGNNPAFGLRYTRRFDDHADTYMVNLVRDSYSTPSLMLAAGRMWPVAEAASLKVEAGVVVGVWFRAVLNYEGDSLVRRAVPFVLPSMAVTESNTGIGLDFGFAPKLQMNGYSVNRTPTLMVQFTYLVKKTEHGETKVGLQSNEAGGIQASLSKSF